MKNKKTLILVFILIAVSAAAYGIYYYVKNKTYVPTIGGKTPDGKTIVSNDQYQADIQSMTDEESYAYYDTHINYDAALALYAGQ